MIWPGRRRRPVAYDASPASRGERFRDLLSAFFGRRIVGSLTLLGIFVFVGQLGRVFA